jgi:peptidoglycan/xylan/chitin deacetylase (PgdA/CDA1 family)
MIYRRFGFTRAKSIKALQRIVALTSKHGCIPSFFVTADLLNHHLHLVEMLSQNKVDVGLHGHYHIDHSLIPFELQRLEIQRALEIFNRNNIKVNGFRGPFLRFNAETAKAVAENRIPWVSQSVMLIEHNNAIGSLTAKSSIKRLLDDFYTQECHEANLSLPRWGPHCLEIPVSMPDDEVLVDRLGIGDPKKLTEIFLGMLETSYRKGELFNFLFHPERIDFIDEPLDILLEYATSLKDVWVASLNEISHWWHGRTSAFELAMINENNESYQVCMQPESRACPALQYPGGKLEFPTPDSDGGFTIKSRFKPVIGILPGFSEESVRYLVNEGFIIDSDTDLNRCALVLDSKRSRNNRESLQAVDEAKGPLIRFWRWPGRFKSALAISTDVDAMSLWDFVRRARHFHNFRSS